MKRRWMALVLCLVIAICTFGACNSKTDNGGTSDKKDEAKVTAESIMEKVRENTKTIKSVTADMDMQMSMSMSMMGETVEMSIVSNSEIEAYETSSHTTMRMTMEYAGEKETQDAQTYIVIEDGKIVVYSGDDDGWYRMAAGDIAGAASDWEDTLGVASLLGGNMKYNLEEKTSTVNGKEVYVLTQEIDYETFMKSLGEDNSLSDTLAGMDFTGRKFLTTISIDKDTYLPAKTTMEIVSVEENSDEATGDDSEELMIDISELKIEITFKSFDEIDSIVVPDDVKSVAEDFDSSLLQ